MAQSKWCKSNNTTHVPNYAEGGPNDTETQAKIIEAIQEEQHRVYQQDLKLLAKFTQADHESLYNDNASSNAGGANASEQVVDLVPY